MSNEGAFTGAVWDAGSRYEVKAFAKQQDRRFRRALIRAHPELGPAKARRVRPDPGPALSLDVAASRERGWHAVLDEVATRHKVTAEDILCRYGNREAIAARHEVCYRLRNELQLSLPAIGRLLDGRDHSTILNSIGKYEELLEELSDA